MRIRNDEAIGIDALGRTNFASALARVVESCDTPLVVGLYGTWGIGKTSLMKQIEAKLREVEKIKLVWFDPWRHQFDEDPAVALLHTMITQLELGDEAKKLLCIIAAALGSLFLKATTTLNADDIQKLGERYEQERFQLREKQVRLQEYFCKLISQATDKGKYRVVFFIDDLDRCMPEQVLKVLEALKLYLALPNCVYIMGVDRAALECSIRHRYKDQEVKEADYLDKIVQLPFTIPPIEGNSMKRFIESLLDGILAEATELLVLGLGDNPRHIKRFINTFMLNHELASEAFGNSYSVKLLAAVLIIQYRRPELFKLAVRDPGVLVNLSKGGDVAKPYEDHIKGDPQLASVIASAEFKKAAEIAPYIYLSAVAGVRTQDFDVIMTSVGSNKISVIKIIRERTSLGLKESKDLSDQALPALIATGLTREVAEAFASDLVAAGALAEVR
jgi:ribosomal protein L7/L12